MTRVFLTAGALFGATGVLLGAFGAHALRDQLAPEALSSWDTAVTYQLFHALALLFAGVFAGSSTGKSAGASDLLDESPASRSPTERALNIAGLSWIVGILLFSGSIYVLAIGGPRWVGPVTPLGGLGLITGWVSVLVAAVKSA